MGRDGQRGQGREDGRAWRIRGLAILVAHRRLGDGLDACAQPGEQQVTEPPGRQHDVGRKRARVQCAKIDLALVAGVAELGADGGQNEGDRAPRGSRTPGPARRTRACAAPLLHHQQQRSGQRRANQGADPVGHIHARRVRSERPLGL